VGIHCILGCWAETQAPGLAENDILLVRVPLPGGNGAPGLIAVVIIRSNVPRPSDLSR
jgi:hypothetical protein